MEQESRSAYTCPICGEKAQLGSHFCAKGKKAAKTPTPSRRRWNPRSFATLVALLAIALLLAQYGGRGGFLLGVALGLGGLFVWLALRLQASRDSDGYRSLLQMSGGDRETVERLIAAEARRHPKASREENIDTVLGAWQRDRG